MADITAIFTSGREIVFRGIPVIQPADINDVIEARLWQLGYKAEVLSTEPELVVRLRTPEQITRRKFPWVNVLLFLVTCVTTIIAGAWNEGVNFLGNPGILLHDPQAILKAGLPFSLSLLAILLFHEFGHYTAARIHKVNVTLPYFVPAPTVLGTFGAFIRSKSPFMNRKQLLDVAASGPLAGLAVSIIVLIIGISGSTLVPAAGLGTDNFIFGESLLHKLLTLLIKGPIPSGEILQMNTVAFAGWAGLLVTMFNLLPIGQLDGGHIIYALFGKYQKALAYAAMLGLIVLSFWWSGWAIWLFVSFLVKPAHPPTLMDDIPVGRATRIVGYLSIAAFIICFMPVPIWYS